MADSPKKRLLKIVIVVLIIPVILCLWFIWHYFFQSQYNHRVEESRQAEPRLILTELENRCAALFDKNNNTNVCNAENLLIGINSELPGPNGENCKPNYFFYYSVENIGDSKIAFVANRCIKGGKDPQGEEVYNLKLKKNYSTGESTWEDSFSGSTKVPHYNY